MTTANESSQTQFDALRVLVVDDHVFIRKTLVGMLQRIGVRTLAEAADGDEGLRVLADVLGGQADVIFCDLMMPGRDGIETLRDLAALGVEAGIVLISGEDQRILATATDLARSQGLRVLGALTKPVMIDKVRVLLERAHDLSPKRKRAAFVHVTSADLERGLAAGEITLRYQPKVGVVDRAFVGVEALVRWEHPEHGTVPPDAFISVAEETDLIDRLTDRILELAATQVRDWRRAGMDLQVAINLSVQSLNRLDLPDHITGLLARFEVPNERITLEITESRMASDVSAALDIVARLRLKQFHLSIDDFGTGFSSMSQLRRMPFNEMKIDRSFVNGADEDPAARSILESSVELARKLNMQIVAEGVETRTDWELIAELGVDLAQGFLVAKPLPGGELIAWAATWRSLVW